MRFAVLIVAFLMSTSAWADLYLEPYVGYLESIDDSSVTASGVTLSGKANYHGVIYGGKLGAEYSLLAVGGDFLGGSLQGGGASTNIQNFGAFVQISLPLLIKLSGSYYFSGKETSNGITGTGTGFKIGFGFDIIPYLSLNFDYLSMNYDKLSGSGVSAGYDKVTGGIASISIPISL